MKSWSMCSDKERSTDLANNVLSHSEERGVLGLASSLTNDASVK